MTESLIKLYKQGKFLSLRQNRKEFLYNCNNVPNVQEEVEYITRVCLRERNKCICAKLNNALYCTLVLNKTYRNSQRVIILCIGKHFKQFANSGLIIGNFLLVLKATMDLSTNVSGYEHDAKL